jgi:hypothetical protein
MGFGNKVGSIAQLKKSLEKNSSTSDDVWIKYVPKDGELTVRFLTEPDEWVLYHEAWDPAGREGKGTSYPVPNDMEVPDDQRVSKRYLASAVDVDTDRVIPICIPTSLMQAVVLRYEKHGTIVDRDYELARQGKGLDTQYLLSPESPLPRKMDKYEPLDLEAVLGGAYNSYAGITSAPTVDVSDIPVHDADEELVPKDRPTAEEASSMAAEAAELEDDISADTPDGALTRDEIMGLPLAAVRTLARAASISTSGMTKEELADALTGADAL